MTKLKLRKEYPRTYSTLEESGLDWGFEHGGSHTKIRAAGRFVGVISGTGEWRKDKNLSQTIRWHLQQMRLAA